MRWHHTITNRDFRGWLVGKEWRRTYAKVEVSWYARLCLVYVEFDEEDALIRFGCAVPYLFLSVGLAWPRRWIPRGGEFGGDITVFKFSINDGSLRWQFWRDDMGWSSDTPKWRDGHFNPMDFIFGHKKYSEDVLETVPVSVVMPEKAYPGTVKLLQSKWKRPRAWWTSTMRRADIDVPGGVPFPGKGENSWDCGEDAAFSMTCPATTAQEAVETFRQSVERDRKRYGGNGWLPEVAGAAQ